VRRFLYDTNVFVYALGAAHAYRDSSRQLVRRQGEGELAGEVTTTVVAELVHQRLRQTGDRAEAARRGRQVALACRVHASDAADAELAWDLYERRVELDAFDALLAATALNRGIGFVVSADRAFDAVEGLERIDPLDERAVGGLTTG
jgi:predicted nucleic acid-binding protein